MKGIPQKNTPRGVKYYAVIYLFNNTFHGIPFDTEEEARKHGEEWIKKANKENAEKHDPKTDPFVKNFYIMKRNLDKYDNGEVI